MCPRTGRNVLLGRRYNRLLLPVRPPVASVSSLPLTRFTVAYRHVRVPVVSVMRGGVRHVVSATVGPVRVVGFSRPMVSAAVAVDRAATGRRRVTEEVSALSPPSWLLRVLHVLTRCECLTVVPPVHTARHSCSQRPVNLSRK